MCDYKTSTSNVTDVIFSLTTLENLHLAQRSGWCFPLAPNVSTIQPKGRHDNKHSAT